MADVVVVENGERINLFKALVPFVPLVFLLISGPPLNWIQIPKDWLIPVDWIKDKEKSKIFDARLIGAAMIAGAVVAGLTSFSKLRSVPKSFFEGAGYAFAEIVSLIVVAQAFGKAIELAGFKKFLEVLILQNESLLLPLAAALPSGFAFLSGSGMAATSSLYEIFVEPARHLGHDPMQVGALVSIASAAGRTMSPFAAVVLMSAKMTGTNPFDLVRRVAPPLLIGIVTIVILRSWGMI
jgi:DcuC family C4-dicarboxylate transporter